jgi:hypothetical protein
VDRAGASAQAAFRRTVGWAVARWLAALTLGGAGVWALAAGDRWVGVGALLAALAARPGGDAGRWRRGAGGERATAAALARLPRRRWAVLHDRSIPGSRANLDHLAIGPTGVWLIDSKAYRGAVRVRWGRVRVAGRPIDTGPTRWEAAVVEDRLGVEVVPLVVLHAPGLRRRGGRSGDVRVLPARSLVRELRRRPAVLPGDSVERIAGRAARLFPPATGC